MKKEQVVKAIQEGLKENGFEFNLKETESVYETVTDIYAELLKTEDKVPFGKAFGNFTGKDKDARTARNPQSGEPVEVAATRTITFKPVKSYKDSLKK